MLDFVLAGIALLCLAYALTGAAMIASAWNDLALIQRDCSAGECDHDGRITGASSFQVFRYQYFCALTLDLDTGTRRVAVDWRNCSQFTPGSPVVATVWRGNVVVVKTVVGTMGTTENPGVNVGYGLGRLLGLIPLALVLGMIHVDVANHPVVVRVLGGRRAPDHDFG